MREILTNMFIGDDNDCIRQKGNMAIIHACKTCHQKGVGYHGNLPSSHPNYMSMVNNEHLYLNMVDMNQEFLPRFTHPMMQISLSFIKKFIAIKPVLIHCNQGFSRSPSIGLVYLARKNIITNLSYNEAKSEFLTLYPVYNPGRGIELYLQKNWSELIQMEEPKYEF